MHAGPAHHVPGLPAPGRCLVMGVVNVTPDSFSDGGLFLDPDAAVAHGLELVAQGAKTGLDPMTEAGRLDRARWERHLTEAQFALGDFGAALEHAQRALSWSGQSLPQSQPGWILRLIREIPVQAAHRIAPAAIRTPEGST